ncbi:leucine--tRNA ligase, partial [Candidatus Parcubacteria bacterium]|nr:leucine--tRNA ligase [Candidatus Parcubacteria bacterium]
MDDYDHQQIEQKWQKRWEKQDLYQAKDLTKKPKFYVLVEFPYPSGAGLHVGHLRSYSALDAVARYKRMSGFNVLFPMGWDAFGLPTENYAIKMKRQPAEITKENITIFKKQIKSVGLSFDWSREINTTDPNYYKWTQWIFLQLYKKGLAYRREMPINWCPSCKIGLANEEVINGKCERCGAQTEKRQIKQWMLAITKYAERLIKDLDTVDYLDKIKTQQVNWIGRSEGASVKFKISDSGFQIEVFTTRPDTLFGATFMVLAPEHELIQKLSALGGKPQITNWKEVEKYIEISKRKSDLERTDLAKEKTGVELKGVKAINPANNKEIPIWVADYVLTGYGTGAIMAVPAHDERDFEFALKFKLPIINVILPKDKMKSYFMEGSFENDIKDQLKKFDYHKDKKDGYYVNLSSKNIDKYIEIVKKNLKKDYWCEIIGSRYIFIFGDGEVIEVKDIKDEEGALKKCKKFYDGVKDCYNLTRMLWNCGFYHDLVCNTDVKEGVMINSDQFNSMSVKKCITEITKWIEKEGAGKKAVNYKLRDWVFSRQHYWGEPIPIIHCKKCASASSTPNSGEVPVPEKDLPVVLPKVKNYEPTDTGESPLAAMADWVNTKCPKCGGPAKRETDTMPNWAGSSWYFLRYIDPNNSKALADPKKLKHWMPVDLYNGGMEHTTLHLLYSRFWNKFLYDIGVVPISEPYVARRSHGMVLAEDSQKMSKSRGNVTNPDELIKKYGADTLRLYEMFMGPFSEAIPWSTENMIGVKRFLDKVWGLQSKVKSQTSLKS